MRIRSRIFTSNVVNIYIWSIITKGQLLYAKVIDRKELYRFNCGVGDEGDKLYLVLSGELDVYTTKTEMESKQFQQEQIEKENSPTADQKRSPTNSNKSRSPRRTQRLTRRESMLSNVPTEDDDSPTTNYGRKNTDEGGDSDRSGSDSRRSSIIFNRLRKLKPSNPNNTKNNTVRMIDIKELAYFSSLDAFRGNNEMLWDEKETWSNSYCNGRLYSGSLKQRRF
jgi:hypothetical protein